MTENCLVAQLFCSDFITFASACKASCVFYRDHPSCIVRIYMKWHLFGSVREYGDNKKLALKAQRLTKEFSYGISIIEVASACKTRCSPSGAMMINPQEVSE